MESAREKAVIAKTLVLFIKSLIGSKVTVELTNGTNVTGILENVDAFMNLTLVANGSSDTCRVNTANPDQLACDSLFIKGPRVRSVNYSTGSKSELEMMTRQLERPGQRR